MANERNANEGEGSRSADERYRKGVREHLENADVEGEAERARRDVEADPDTYRRAEEEGKEPSAGDLPADLEEGGRS
jgi:hypothetical protein